VDCGPGSFTGLRVGLAAAHGLGIGWHVPIAGYSSLALIAAAAVCQAANWRLRCTADTGSFSCRPMAAIRSTPRRSALARARRGGRGDRGGVRDRLGRRSLVDARGSGTAVDALPRAADARLLPAPLRSLPVRPIYGRAPDAKPQP
jgi:hypothetical protein